MNKEYNYFVNTLAISLTGSRLTQNDPEILLLLAKLDWKAYVKLHIANIQIKSNYQPVIGDNFFALVAGYGSPFGGVLELVDTSFIPQYKEAGINKALNRKTYRGDSAFFEFPNDWQEKFCYIPHVFDIAYMDFLWLLK